jgi:endonuclease/exonuclease/phosphatase family metal-dependent hydrolase
VQLFNRNISFAELRELVIYRKRKELSRFNKLMLWLNYLAMLCIILSYCARFINPQTFWLLAFFGIGYPIILLLNLFFVLYWIIQWKPIALWSLVVILFGWNTLSSFAQIHFGSELPNNKDIKVMSYNSMLFDLYNWSKNSESRKTIFTMLSEENPDILCIQEYYTSEQKGDFNNTDTLTRFLKTNYSHIEYTMTLRDVDHWGVATFTKYPIVRKGKIDFNTRWNNMCIYTDVLINKDTVRIYNMHLASIHFGKKDHQFIEDVIEKNDTEELEGSKNILRLLKRAFVTRSRQAAMVAEHMRSCRYKMIVCGDFNDTPSSYAYRTVRGDLKDAFMESGRGIGTTYAGKIPFQRIDYILHDESFSSYNYKVIGETITDHYPISCYLRTQTKQ